MQQPGTLYLVPTGLGGDPGDVLPPETRARLLALTVFIVENAKSARQFLKSAGYPHALQTTEMHVLDEHTRAAAMTHLLAPLLAGHDCGLLSEAGAPAVADPGALLVRLAHQTGIRVVPLVGPSAVLLALMASGLNGQRFDFHGYLPVRDEERAKRLKEVEHASQLRDSTQIFIEAPYRNNSLMRAILESCRDDTLLCIAADLSLPSEFIRTQPIAAWRKTPPDLDRRPAVFLLYCSLSAARRRTVPLT